MMPSTPSEFTPQAGFSVPFSRASSPHRPFGDPTPDFSTIMTEFSTP